MTEGKKRKFSRNAVEKNFLELCERIRNIDYKDFDAELETVLVYGSFVNTNKEKIHDLDVFVQVKRKKFGSENEKNDFYEYLILKSKKAGRYRNNYYGMNYDLFELIYYLKGTSRIISIHFGDELDIALNDKHIWLVKNCNILSEPIEEEGLCLDKKI